MNDPRAANLGIQGDSAQSERSVPVWVLLGKNHGDNRQALALAEAAGYPFRAIQLHFRPRLSRLPGVILGRSLLPLSKPVAWPAAWPQIVIASGRRAVPVARWIQGQAGRSGVTTRLVHLGRPRAPLGWFDLIISTPQYGLPTCANVLNNLLPFQPDETDDEAVALSPALNATLDALPRPWTVVLVGGNSRPYYFSRGSAQALATGVDYDARISGGSVLVLGSPRTPNSCLDEIERHISAPLYLYRWQADENPYPALLRLADRLVVTGDSLSMLGDAVVTGKPLQLFSLPKRLDKRAHVAMFYRRMAERWPIMRKPYHALMDAGLLFSLRSLEKCHQSLREAGVFSSTSAGRTLAAGERRETIRRLRLVLANAGPSPQ
ncbi:MAG TPA: ELM1/GtrOC1 family putative glycosyltransferase [Solimonas sp.]|nr:ELM1/GtrOC1 family putative glycosyltransferase [Solimonas sp.]